MGQGKEVRMGLKKFCFRAEKTDVFEISGKILKILLVFRDFDHQYSVFMQNKDDIQNQHKKLHRIMYILPKNIFHQN